MTDILDQEGIDQLLLLLPSRSNESLKKWIKGLGDPLDEQSKNKAYELYDNGLLRDIEVGSTRGLQQIHAYIFGGLYDFAGKIRTRNIMKDNFVFCDARYLNSTLKKIDRMSEDSLKQIVDKYIEMNIAHPFMEGNGRATRIWFDQILKKNLKKCVDWSKIDKKDYLNAMKRSPLNSKAIYQLIESALTGKINDRQIFMKGIDYSYYYEELD
ncbi:MAG: Fic family protein [Erysipelotrichaceae bacterium]|nr:Fic family protein [Erysipelotrichaceae bacterium]